MSKLVDACNRFKECAFSAMDRANLQVGIHTTMAADALSLADKSSEVTDFLLEKTKELLDVIKSQQKALDLSEQTRKLLLLKIADLEAFDTSEAWKNA